MHDDNHNHSKGNFKNNNQRNGSKMPKERAMLDIKEMVDPPRNHGTPGINNQMLLTIRKKSTILYLISALMKHWTLRLPKKCSLVRNLMSLILKFLEVLYIFMCQKRKEEN